MTFLVQDRGPEQDTLHSPCAAIGKWHIKA